MKIYKICEIKELLSHINVDLIGFTLNDYDEDNYYEKALSKQNYNHLYPRSFPIEDYLNINKEIEEVGLIISIGLSYNYQKDKNIFYSKVNYGLDYHYRIRSVQEDIINTLKNEVSNLNYSLTCDTKALDDRYFAYLCGLGFYGKNSMLINDEYGSNVAYGTIITNIKVKPFKVDRLSSKCGECMLCELSCPHQALSNYQLAYRKCLSYLTQSKELFDYPEGFDSIYGCDICNDVCPYNRSVFEKNSREPQITIEEFLNLSKKQLREMYQNKSFLWLNSQILKKNSLMLAYKKADREEKEKLIKKYSDSASALLNQTISYLKKDYQAR